MSDSQTVKVRRTSAEKFLPACLSSIVKHGPQVHVCGIVGPYDPGPLKVVARNMNSIKYQENIVNDIKTATEAIIFSLKSGIFMQDKAHWSASTRQHLSALNAALLPWPRNSPDAKPIEYVWFHVGRQLIDCDITNQKDLFQKVQELWYNLDVSYLQNYTTVCQKGYKASLKIEVV